MQMIWLMMSYTQPNIISSQPHSQGLSASLVIERKTLVAPVTQTFPLL